jgi:acyl-CoA synthetase (AMP-forming)/AMP-acid ligase II
MSRVDPLPVSTIIESLFARADTAPDDLAYVVDETDTITYGHLREEVLRTAAALANQGLEQGQCCALILPTGLDFIRILYATQALGAIPIALNPGLPAELILRRLRLVHGELVIAQEPVLAALRAAATRDHSSLHIVPVEDIRNTRPRTGPPLVNVGPEALAYLQFTSGTTGEPRAAMISHQNLIASLRAAITRLEITPADVFVSWVPLHHDLGLVRFVFGPLFFGCPVYLLQPSITNLRGWLETATRVRATITGSPDFGYRIAARTVDPQGIDLRALRFATNGGEPARLGTIERFEQRFGLSGVLRPGYGLAEATLGVTSLAAGEPLRTGDAGNVSCGRPFDGSEIKIVDAEGRALSAGHPGVILVRGTPVFAGYFHDPVATRPVRRDGWLYTGDIGSLDDDGHLSVLGRKRALIKRAGALIPPREIEEVIDQIDGVRLSAAIGHSRTADSGTEDVIVIAEVRPDVATSEASRAALARLIVGEVTRAIGFTPREAVLVSPRTIPRTYSGKIQYDRLRQLYAEGALAR